MAQALFEEQVSERDRVSASEDARSWGFPRAVCEYEILTGRWFRLGSHAIVWYESGGIRKRDYAIHIAVHPDYRGRWPARSFVRFYADVARSIGAARLLFFPIDENDQVVSILTRLGWVQNDAGLALELGA